MRRLGCREVCAEFFVHVAEGAKAGDELSRVDYVIFSGADHCGARTFETEINSRNDSLSKSHLVASKSILFLYNPAENIYDADDMN